MNLSKLATEVRRAARPLEEAEAPAFRSGRAEVEKLVDALLGGAQVKARAQAVLGREGNFDKLVSALRLALYPVVVHTLQQLGGKVSGAAGVQAALRTMAREDVGVKDGPSVPLGERLEDNLHTMIDILAKTTTNLVKYLDYGSGYSGPKAAAFGRITKAAGKIQDLVKELKADLALLDEGLD